MGTLIGAASAPMAPEDIIPWIASFRDVCPENRVILLTDQPDAFEVERKVWDLEIRRADLNTAPNDLPPRGEGWRGNISVYKDRWRELGLLGLPGNEIVLMTDTRDVIFQRDPFEQIHPDCVTVASEGETFGTNYWNRRMLEMYWPEHASPLYNTVSICAGVVGGPYHLLRDLGRDVWTLVRHKSGMGEQALVNILLRDGRPLHIIPYTEGWCIHCAAMLTEWAKPEKDRLEETPDIIQGRMFTKSGRLFALVHHWPMLHRNLGFTWPEEFAI